VDDRCHRPKDREASIQEILPRKNELIRPAVANIDQAMILFALASPDPDELLLDRFLS
jgi:ribosome biogenesis GTPase